jgi:formylglycine-generating enzyme required for sulfatase activity
VFSVTQDKRHGIEAAPTATVVKATWNDAIANCKTLTINGFTGWRLPNKDELELLCTTLDPPYKKIEKGFLSDILPRYWSSTEDGSGQYLFGSYSTKVWCFSPVKDYQHDNKNLFLDITGSSPFYNKFYVWLVRDF